MNWLNKYQKMQRTPAGIEWQIIKKLPLIFFLTVILPIILGLIFYFFFNFSHLSSSIIFYVLIGMILILWSFLMVITIGVVIVYIMKGPAYVADGYFLPEHLLSLPIDKDQFFEE